MPYEIVAAPSRRPGRDLRRPDAIGAMLGWQPTHGLDDIIATAWRWHSTHLDGYDD